MYKDLGTLNYNVNQFILNTATLIKSRQQSKWFLTAVR
ncbi:MAG: hypothetical protein ACI8VY_001113, partial [Cellvibrionaceae bacterium]